MLGAVLCRRLVFGKPMALSICLKIGLLVLLVQFCFLFFFNTSLTSRNPRSVAPPLLVHLTHKPADNSLHFIPQQLPPQNRLDPRGQEASDPRIRQHEVNLWAHDLRPNNKNSQQLLRRKQNQGQPVNTHIGLHSSQIREVIRDTSLARSPNAQDDAVNSTNLHNQLNVHQNQTPLSKRNTHQQSWRNQLNVHYTQNALPKQSTQKSRMATENAHPNQFLLLGQKPRVSYTNQRNVAQKQQHLLNGRTPPVHSDNTQLVAEEDKRRSFYVTLLKPRQKTVLARGCTERGVGNHVTSLAFVKVHKSASTTVANILARYALRHTLNIALPWKKPGSPRFNYFESRIIPDQVMPIPRGQRYQMVFNHMIFHRKDLQFLMPNNTYYFAIMRDPLERFLSSLIYYGFAQFIVKKYRFPSVKAALMYIIKHPGILLSRYSKPELYNSLAGDTGLPTDRHIDVHFVKAHIQQLEHELDFIMVVEYFDESLVLLKRRSCLSMQDIVYAVKNARSQQAQTVVSLTPQEKAEFEKFQMADVIMYRHFYRKFWNLVYAEGPSFFEEVRQFKEIQRTVTAFCRSVESIWDFVTVTSSAWNEEFVVTARECRLMRVSELDMQFYLIDRANKLYAMNKGG